MTLQEHLSSETHEAWEEQPAIPGWLQVGVVLCVVLAIAIKILSDHRSRK